MDSQPDRRGFLKVGIGALAGLAVGETILLTPGESLGQEPLSRKGVPRKRKDYRQAKKVTGVCLNCSTVCGIVGYVIDGQVVKIAGNPEDPNNGATICAKGHSGVTVNTYPERLLYPLKRAGKRGAGLWRRITWEEAYGEMAQRIRKCINEGHPEQVAIHVGRSRIGDVIDRFLSAMGSPVSLNHRALCSLNKRAANYACIGDTDWESVDAERTKYLLNFGSNFYEAHQGHIHFLKRVIKGRYDNGAKLVTFDVRLSNTAGRSDEWFAPFPGSEGALALAMGHVILRAGEYDGSFLATWTNYPLEQLKEFYAPYTPDWAVKLSGVPAKDIERLALEFARCRPRCAAFTNRGSHAHYNGFNNDRAVILLNALVGSIGAEGGYVFGPGELNQTKFPAPAPVPPKPKLRTDLEDPPEYPLCNFWQKMKVGQLVYAYLQEKRAKLQVYLSYTLGSPMTWPEGRSRTKDVLLSEELIPFHVCSDVVYSEMAHYADLILPDASYLERWGLDSRNCYAMKPYVTLRQPMVPSPAECVSFADVLIQLGKRLGPEVAKFFAFKDHEEYVRHQCRNVPKGDCEDGFAYMQRHGVWLDPKEPSFYDCFRRPLTAAQLQGTRTDPGTGVIYRTDAKTQKEEAIGVLVNGKAMRGFKTPSRKFEIHSGIVAAKAAQVGIPDDGLPRYHPVPALADLPEDRLVFVTFKWNVHTQARTAPQKLLSEIVHDNPVWINTATAARLGIRTGDLVEITTYRPKGKTFAATGERLGSVRVRAFVTEGIHPRVLAMSNSLGHQFGGRAATARCAPRPDGPGFDPHRFPEDPDLAHALWWDASQGGKGAGFNVNAVLPIQPSPVTGMQSWYDTVCTVKKV